MTRLAFVVLGSAFFTILEALLRGIGLAVPLLAFFVFSVAYSFSRSWAIFAGCFFGALLDFLFGRAFPASAILFPLLALPGSYFRAHRMTSLLMQSLPGLLIPVYAVLPDLTLFLSSLENFSILILSCASGVVLLPAVAFVTERLARLLEIVDPEKGAAR